MPVTPRLNERVSALYVMSTGVYPTLVADWWNKERNAKLYTGPRPVVAHPPCGPWGKLRTMCTKQDPLCGLRATDQVRTWGGVLEHPQHSLLWDHRGLPKPLYPYDNFGGYTLCVNQLAWGHVASKWTWLYIVGVDRAVIEKEIRTGGKATHIITTGKGVKRDGLKVTSHRLKDSTPLEFAKWLISIAERCR